MSLHSTPTPSHPAFTDIVRQVDKLAHGDPRFAVRYLNTLIKGRAEQMFDLSKPCPGLLNLLQLSFWLEKMREHYQSLSEGHEDDTRN